VSAKPVPLQSFEPVTSKNAEACVANLEARLISWQESIKKDFLPVYTKPSDERIEPRLVAVEKGVLGAIDKLAKYSNKTNSDEQSAIGRNTNLSGRGKELDAMMGISKPASEIKMVGNSIQLGAMSPEQARQFIKSRG
jgi:hypothetical protein